MPPPSPGVSWVRLQLDLDTFDEAGFVANLQRCQESGITFTTMARLGDTAECRRALYELNKTCSADIPERGEFYTFDEYLAERIETRLHDPRVVRSRRRLAGLATHWVCVLVRWRILLCYSCRCRRRASSTSAMTCAGT